MSIGQTDPERPLLDAISTGRLNTSIESISRWQQLDEPDAFHQPQGLVEHSRRRVRQVRRVQLESLPRGV